MSDLRRIKVTVRNYDVQGRGDLDVLFNRVRLEDEQGSALGFKQVVMLRYLERQGAMAINTPMVWYYKPLGKKTVVLVAFERSGGKVEYELDDMGQIVKSAVLKGILVALGMIPGGIIAATATFGVGLLLIPLGLWYGYRNAFKLPAMLRRSVLLKDLAAFGVEVR